MDSEEKTLTLADSIAIIMGIVIGAGIFRTPSLVAANSGTGLYVILVWIAGGIISIVGALCYSELASTYPNRGGDYHYIHRAFGLAPAFLFAWARMTVIQTGSIAMLAFILGDYASELFHLGPYSSALYALATVAALTGLNITGVRQGSWTQKVFTLAIVLGLFSMIAIGLVWSSPVYAGPSAEPLPTGAGLGKAMIFVLLTYGGWNEAAYLSSELRGSRLAISRALILSIGAITLIGLKILAVPLALILAIISGLLTFIPTFGLLISIIPAVILAMTGGLMKVVYVIFLYLFAHAVEAYVAGPLVQKRMVALPPVLTIVGLFIFGELFGILGLIVATPLIAASLVVIRMLYFEDVLGDIVDPAKII